MVDSKEVLAGGAVELPDTPEEIQKDLTRELKKQMRAPFERALQRLLGFRPSAAALQNFANKSPDRWAQAVSIMAGLSGYEKGINVNVRVKNVTDMSDSELLAEYRAAAGFIAARAQGVVGEVVDAEVIPPLPAPREKKTGE